MCPNWNPTSLSWFVCQQSPWFRQNKLSVLFFLKWIVYSITPLTLHLSLLCLCAVVSEVTACTGFATKLPHIVVLFVFWMFRFVSFVYHHCMRHITHFVRCYQPCTTFPYIYIYINYIIKLICIVLYIYI